jgi:hypothetical protein
MLSMRSYRPIIGLMLVIFLFISPFVYNYIRYALGFSTDPTDGRFAGIVHITYTGDDLVTGKPITRDLGQAVVEYKQRPLAFSYLSRVHSEARIADGKGNERIFKIVHYDHWQMAWHGPSQQLFTAGPNNDILEGNWHTSVNPFKLEFEQTYEFPRNTRLGAGIFHLTGTLQPASKETYDLLRQKISR